MRNEGLARLKLSRKQLVIVVTYRSSVTLTSWDMSHHPVPLSDLVVLPNNPSPSSLSFMAVFGVFCFPLRACQLSALVLSALSLPHLTLTTPTSSIFALLLISVEDVWQDFSCDKAQLSADKPRSFVSLVCRRTHARSLLAFSYKTILSLRPIKAPRWRPPGDGEGRVMELRCWWKWQDVKPETGMHSGCWESKIREKKTFVFCFAFYKLCVTV